VKKVYSLTLKSICYNKKGTDSTPETGMRCIVLYSGIHYDAVTLAPMKDAPEEWHQTLFPVVSSRSQFPFTPHNL